MKKLALNYCKPVTKLKEDRYNKKGILAAVSLECLTSCGAGCCLRPNPSLRLIMALPSQRKRNKVVDANTVLRNAAPQTPNYNRKCCSLFAYDQIYMILSKETVAAEGNVIDVVKIW